MGRDPKESMTTLNLFGAVFRHSSNPCWPLINRQIWPPLPMMLRALAPPYCHLIRLIWPENCSYVSHSLAGVVKITPATCFASQGHSSSDSLTGDESGIVLYPTGDRVSKVITFFFPHLKSATFLVKSGLKLNFEHCGNHRKEVFWIFLSNLGC